MQRFSQFIKCGQWFALDEKNKKWIGSSPCFRLIRRKTQPKGQWTSEVCVRLSSSGLSYCTALYSFLSGKHSSVKVFLADVADTAITSVCGVVGENGNPIMCADAFYVSQDVLGELTERYVPYHLSAPSNRLPAPLVAMLQRRVTDVGTWAAVHNEVTKQTILHYWDPNPDIGKKFLLTTLLRPSDRPSPPVLLFVFVLSSHSLC